ncbi:MAG: glycosyltransferase [Glaciimonas sp.]|nr:glycosyltransferase [Glaciimonas sp.]
MRIVLDLQACQTSSRKRGIGRASLAFAQALARRAGAHELIVVTNESLADGIAGIGRAMSPWIPPERIVSFSAPPGSWETVPANLWRARAGELLREAFIAAQKPDIVHVSSLFEGLLDDAHTSVGRYRSDIATAVTLYDLIPLLRPDKYLSEPAVRDWYYRKLQSLKNAQLLLAISAYSRTEAIAALGVPCERIINIGLSIDAHFQRLEPTPAHRLALQQRLGMRRPFIMYTAGDDERKNVPGLISAYALLPAAVRAQHQLLVICHSAPEIRQKLLRHATVSGLQNDELVLLSEFVADDDLIALYSSCRLFVFPSLHEGFGLPVLEAMACGAPVIASNTTSLPEVVGRADALFDPHSPHAISIAIAHALGNADFLQSLRDSAPAQVAKFSWDNTAQRALDAFEQQYAHDQAQQAVSIGVSGFAPVPACRPRLAFVSPLPPERSGIADYSAELLPALAAHYDIELIVHDAQIGLLEQPWLQANYPVRSVSWFEAHAGRYARVLYQVGNSYFHLHMFGLLQRIPGTVVLHDFYLSGAYSSGGDLALQRELFHSHGWRGLQAMTQGKAGAVDAYPCNLALLEAAQGVIVHSRFAQDASRSWYGADLARRMQVIPLLRGVAQRDRAAARARLGLGHSDFLVCSFGLLAPSKRNRELLDAWLQSELSGDAHCKLAFVGENHGGEYGDDLLATIERSPCRQRISITGHASEQQYEDYLAAADLAVQLRGDSRGETSRAALDCMAAGLALIVNANGPMAELPDAAACKLPDLFSVASLSAALGHFWRDPAARADLGAAACRHVLQQHHPAVIAARYAQAIESFYADGPLVHERQLIAALAAQDESRTIASESDIDSLAHCIQHNHPTPRQKRLYIDISTVAVNDLKTGIERVTRSILKHLLEEGEEQFRIEPVYAADGLYRCANAASARLLGLQLAPLELQDTVVEAAAGDIFLGLDWAPEAVLRNRPTLDAMRRRQVRIVFVVYDLLPLQLPSCFPAIVSEIYRDWLLAITELSDGIACISRSVADELQQWIDVQDAGRSAPPLRPMLGHFHLGADIDNSLPTAGMADDSRQLLDRATGGGNFLMVSTIEPRKGHAQVLDAFEILWQQGDVAKLVIIGRQGWNSDVLGARIRKHPQYGQRLFWFEGASDDLLKRAYRQSTALIYASLGEGFGLPLIEAASHDLPVLARDIPVLREVAGAHAWYFNADNAAQLAASIRQWQELSERGATPVSTGMPSLDWRQSTQQLLTFIRSVSAAA